MSIDTRLLASLHYISVKDRRIVTADGVTSVIWEMYDFEGDKTEDPDMACAVVAVHPSGHRITIDLAYVQNFTHH